jgi:hypothetical protein
LLGFFQRRGLLDEYTVQDKLAGQASGGFSGVRAPDARLRERVIAALGAAALADRSRARPAHGAAGAVVEAPAGALKVRNPAGGRRPDLRYRRQATT